MSIDRTRLVRRCSRASASESTMNGSNSSSKTTWQIGGSNGPASIAMPAAMKITSRSFQPHHRSLSSKWATATG